MDIKIYIDRDFEVKKKILPDLTTSCTVAPVITIPFERMMFESRCYRDGQYLPLWSMMHVFSVLGDSHYGTGFNESVIFTSVIVLKGRRECE